MPPIDANASSGRRLGILDKILRRDRWFTRQQLWHAVNNELDGTAGSRISESTIRGDLKLLKEIAGEQLMEEKRVSGENQKLMNCYRYSDSSYSIFQLPKLDATDFNYLQQALALLRQIKGLEGGTYLQQTVTKLQFNMPEQDGPPIIMLDTVQNLRGIDYLQHFYEAIVTELPVAFGYQAFTDAAAREILLHPYTLREFNSRWYVIGYNAEEAAVWPYALDRMTGPPKARPKLDFVPASANGFDPHALYANIIGMTLPAQSEPVAVKLRFAPGRAHYEKTKPLHSSQQLFEQDPDGAMVFAYRLHINKELVAAILQFGADVEVLQPQSLRDAIAREAAKVAALYQP